MVTGWNYWVVVGSGNGGGWNWLPSSAKTGVSKGTTGRQNRQNYNSKLRLFHRKLTREGQWEASTSCYSWKMQQWEAGSKGCRCYRILQRGCNGKRPWKSILYYSVEGQVKQAKWEFQKLGRKSATTDCNGKGLPREAATGRWNGMQGRLDRESDWKLE